MSGSRLLTVFIVLVAAVAVVLVAWLIWFRPLRTVVRERPVVTNPIVSSPSTPLREKHDSGPTVKRSRPSRAGDISGNNRGGSRQPATPNKPRSRTRRRPPARTTPDRRRPSQGSQQPAQPSNPPSTSPQPRPPVDVTVPAPVTVCVRGVGGANCP